MDVWTNAAAVARGLLHNSSSELGMVTGTHGVEPSPVGGLPVPGLHKKLHKSSGILTELPPVYETSWPNA